MNGRFCDKMFCKSNPIPQRLILALMCFWAMIIVYTTRTALSFVITKMAPKQITSLNDTECPDYYTNNTNLSADANDQTTINAIYEFDWSEKLQGNILSAYLIGVILLQLPAGMLITRFGGKCMLLIGIGLNAACTLITPFCVRQLGAIGLIILRALTGCGEASVMPAIFELIAAWFPLNERSRSSSFAASGIQMGSIIGAATSGYLLHAFEGWSVVYYVYGTTGVIWCIMFGLLCYNDPDSHPWIGEKEKNYLRSNVHDRNKIRAPTPWKSIWSSTKVWAIVIAQSAFYLSFFIMNMCLPKYMTNILQFSILQSGLLCALPYIGYWIVAQISGALADFLIGKSYMTVTNLRKMFTTISVLIPPIFMLAAAFAECDRYLAVTAFVIGIGLMGTFTAGASANCIDLSPNYVSIIQCVIRFIGFFPGYIAPILTAFLTPNSLISEWKTLFWINFGVAVPSVVAHLIWCSGKVQPWNDPDKIKDSSVEMNT